LRYIVAMPKSKLPLIIAFILTVVSGIFCHIIKDGDASDHHVWVRFQIYPITVSLTFVIFTVKHIKPYKKWYAKRNKIALLHKSKNTVFVSMAMALLIATGIALLFIDGGDSCVGLWHYRLGLVFIVLCGYHAIRRLKMTIKTNVRCSLTSVESTSFTAQSVGCSFALSAPSEPLARRSYGRQWPTYICKNHQTESANFRNVQTIVKCKKNKLIKNRP